MRVGQARPCIPHATQPTLQRHAFGRGLVQHDRLILGVRLQDLGFERRSRKRYLVLTIAQPGPLDQAKPGFLAFCGPDDAETPLELDGCGVSLLDAGRSTAGEDDRVLPAVGQSNAHRGGPGHRIPQQHIDPLYAGCPGEGPEHADEQAFEAILALTSNEQAVDLLGTLEVRAEAVDQGRIRIGRQPHAEPRVRFVAKAPLCRGTPIERGHLEVVDEGVAVPRGRKPPVRQRGPVRLRDALDPVVGTDPLSPALAGRIRLFRAIHGSQCREGPHPFTCLEIQSLDRGTARIALEELGPVEGVVVDAAASDQKEVDPVGRLLVHIAERQHATVFGGLLVCPRERRRILGHLDITEVLEGHQARARYELVTPGRGHILVDRHHRVRNGPHTPPAVHLRARQRVAHVLHHHSPPVIQEQRELVVLGQKVRTAAHHQRARSVALSAPENHHALVAGERRGRYGLIVRSAGGSRGRVEERPQAPSFAVRVPVREVQQQAFGLLAGVFVVRPEVESLQHGPVAAHRLPSGRRPIPGKGIGVTVGRNASARADQLSVLHADANQPRMVEHILDAQHALDGGEGFGIVVLLRIVVGEELCVVLEQRPREIGVHLRVLVVAPIATDHVLQEHLQGPPRPCDQLWPAGRQAHAQEGPVPVELVVLEGSQVPAPVVVASGARLGEQVVVEHPGYDVLADREAVVPSRRRGFVHGRMATQQVEDLNIKEVLTLDMAGLGLHPPHLPLLALGDVERAEGRGRQGGQGVVDQQRLLAEPAVSSEHVGQTQVQKGVVGRASRAVGIGAQAAAYEAVPHRNGSEPLPIVVESVALVVEGRPL